METKSCQTSLSLENEEILKKGASTIQQGWIDVQTLLDRCDSANLNESISALLDQVDDSHYSLGDWLAALLAFDAWLAEKEIAARPLDSMIGYIHCSTMGNAETLADPELARLVLVNLNEWGFDAVAPVSTDSE